MLSIEMYHLHAVVCLLDIEDTLFGPDLPEGLGLSGPAKLPKSMHRGVTSKLEFEEVSFKEDNDSAETSATFQQRAKETES